MAHTPDHIPATLDGVEMTPAMIQAGIDFMIDSAMNTYTNKVTDPEFVREFYSAIVRASCSQAWAENS